jgi:hypothetical protein
MVEQYLSSLERAPTPASYPAGCGAHSFKRTYTPMGVAWMRDGDAL